MTNRRQVQSRRTPAWIYKAALLAVLLLLVAGVLLGILLAGGLDMLLMSGEQRVQVYAQEISYTARMQTWRRAVEIVKDALWIALALIALYLLFRAGLELVGWLHQRANAIRPDEAGALPLIVRGDLLHNPNVTLPSTIRLSDGEVVALHTADEPVQLNLVQGEQRVRMVTAATRHERPDELPPVEPSPPPYHILRPDEMPPELLADDQAILAMDRDWGDIGEIDEKTWR